MNKETPDLLPRKACLVVVTRHFTFGGGLFRNMQTRLPCENRGTYRSGRLGRLPFESSFCINSEWRIDKSGTAWRLRLGNFSKITYQTSRRRTRRATGKQLPKTSRRWHCYRKVSTCLCCLYRWKSVAYQWEKKMKLQIMQLNEQHIRSRES